MDINPKAIVDLNINRSGVYFWAKCHTFIKQFSSA